VLTRFHLLNIRKNIVERAGAGVSSLTLTVDNISHASLSYDPAANSNPDGDSDGSDITVTRPLFSDRGL
jgi:hypothetical protein